MGTTATNVLYGYWPCMQFVRKCKTCNHPFVTKRITDDAYERNVLGGLSAQQDEVYMYVEDDYRIIIMCNGLTT